MIWGLVFAFDQSWHWLGRSNIGLRPVPHADFRLVCAFATTERRQFDPYRWNQPKTATKAAAALKRNAIRMTIAAEFARLESFSVGGF